MHPHTTWLRPWCSPAHPRAKLAARPTDRTRGFPETIAASLCALLLLLTPAASADPVRPTVAPSAAPSSAPTPSPSSAPSDDDGQSSLVNMFGPTVSNAAGLTRVGVPEVELYYASQNNCPAFVRQQQSQFLVKYAFANQWMAMVGSNGFVRQTTLSDSTTDFADPQITLKYLYQPQRGNSSLGAVQLTYKLPAGDAAKAINTGSPDYHLYWMYTRPIGECSLDVNVWLSNVGADDGTRRLLLNESAALTVPLNDRMTYQGEVYHFGANGPVDGITSTLHALTYNLSRTVSIGVAVDFGLNAAAPRVNYIVGGAISLGGPSQAKSSPRAWNPTLPSTMGVLPLRR